jgi:hypothetical protein
VIFSDAQPVQFWLDRLDTFNEKDEEGIYAKCFCQPFQASDEITIQFEETTGYTRKLVVFDENGTFYTASIPEVSSGLFQITFTPASIGATDTQLQFTITDGLFTTIAKSDCISIKETHPETVLINYHNNRIFSSLNSAVGTPDPEFNLRIPAIFFQERFPEESEVIELSNSRNIQLSAQLKVQKKLDIGMMPFYMHQKMKLVLKFQNVTINDQEWVQQEAYEIPDSNKRWPLRRAMVWLNQKDYVVRNVL